MAIKSKRNHTIDLLKAIAAWFVVLNHASFPGAFGEYVVVLSHFASPIFFITAGYFAIHTTAAKTKKSIKKMCRYILFAYVLNFLRLILLPREPSVFSHAFWGSIFSIRHLSFFVLLNESYISGVVWFLFAMLYCYLFRLLLRRQTLIKLSYFCTFVTIIIPILTLINHNQWINVNNVWLRGIPFFAIGGYIRLYIESGKPPISRLNSLLLAMIGVILISISYVTKSQLWHLGTLFLSPSLYYIATQSNVKKNFLCPLGYKYSFMVYIMHPVVINVYDYYRPTIGLMESWLRPICIIILTIIVSLLYYFIKDNIKALVQKGVTQKA